MLAKIFSQAFTKATWGTSASIIILGVNLVEMNHADHYQTALICKMGHVIHDRARETMLQSRVQCPLCGAEGIYQCEHCQAFIRGFNPQINAVDWQMGQAPKYCHQCGEPYPWIQEAIKTMVMIIDILNDLNEAEKTILSENITDLLELNSETDKAMAHVLDLSAKIKNTWGWGIFFEILKDLAPEDVKTHLGICD